MTMVFMNMLPWDHPRKHTVLIFMRYYGASIENTYCYQLSLTTTQSIGYIWTSEGLIRRLKPLKTLTQT